MLTGTGSSGLAIHPGTLPIGEPRTPSRHKPSLIARIRTRDWRLSVALATFEVVDVIAHEPAIRLTIFLAVFSLLAASEAISPRRARTISRRIRWPNNLAIPVLSTLLLRVLLPTTAVGVALLAEERGWGLLHAAEPLPAWLMVVTGVVVLDFAIYLQHVMFHAVPLLWRLHRMHHADLDVDVTTGARFHPIEIVVSILLKFGVIVALGAPPLAALLFEVLL